MTRALGLKLEKVNPLAILAVLSALVLCAFGQVDGDATLTFIAGVAVKGSQEP